MKELAVLHLVVYRSRSRGVDDCEYQFTALKRNGRLMAHGAALAILQNDAGVDEYAAGTHNLQLYAPSPGSTVRQ